MPQDQKTTFTIEVDKTTADAYHIASEETRERALQAFAHVLLSREKRAHTFEEMTRRMTESARKRGLTPDELDELLGDEEGA